MVAALLVADVPMDAYKHFGTLFRSMWTLFELVTLEGWVDIARPLIEFNPLGACSPCSVGRKHEASSDSGGSGLRRKGGLQSLQWKV